MQVMAVHTRTAHLVETLLAGDWEAFIAQLRWPLQLVSPRSARCGFNLDAATVRDYATAFPDLRLIDITVVAGSAASAVEGVLVGTHRAPLTRTDGTTVDASGRSISVPMAAVVTTGEDGLPTARCYLDLAALASQLERLVGPVADLDRRGGPLATSR